MTSPIPTGHVRALGAVRRLRAFAAAGWPTLPISRLTGIPVAELEKLRDRYSATTVPAWFARRVADAYDLISSLDPARTLPDTPAARAAIAHARRTAATAGWQYLPYDWEGVDIDHPARTPERTDERGHLHRRETTAAEVLDLLDTCACAQRVTRAWRRTPTPERIRVVAALSQRSQWPGGPPLNAMQIAARLGITDRGVWHLRAQDRGHDTDQDRAQVSA